MTARPTTRKNQRCRSRIWFCVREVNSGWLSASIVKSLFVPLSSIPSTTDWCRGSSDLRVLVVVFGCSVAQRSYLSLESQSAGKLWYLAARSMGKLTSFCLQRYSFHNPTSIGSFHCNCNCNCKKVNTKLLINHNVRKMMAVTTKTTNHEHWTVWRSRS